MGVVWGDHGCQTGVQKSSQKFEAGEKGANYLDQLKGMTMLMAFHRQNYYKIWLLDLSLGR